MTKPLYINKLDQAIAEYETELRLIILQYQELRNRPLFIIRPFLKLQAKKLLDKYDKTFIKYDNIKNIRFIPLQPNSN